VKTLLTVLLSGVCSAGFTQGMLDTFGGWRDSLETRGISPNIVYSAMPVANVSGGIKTGIRYIDNVDLTLNLDFQKLANVKGLSLFIYGLGNNGGFATQLVGDIQTISNIEAYPTWKLYEAWAQQNLLNNNVSILAGLYDLNSEFDVVKPGLLFLHSSYGLGAELAPTGQNGPSVFPVTSLALRVAATIKQKVRVMAAIMDAVPGDPSDPSGTHIELSREEGALFIFQANINLGKDIYFSKDGNVRKAGTVRRRAIGRGYESPNFNQLIIGAWRYTADFETLDEFSQKQRGNQGAFIAYQRYFYLNAEQTKHITAFARLGIAEDSFNQFGAAISGGIVTAIPILKHNDEMGIAFSAALNGDAYLAQSTREGFNYDQAETNIEFTFNHRLLPYMAIQPSVQYVINPGTDPNLANALVLMCLLQIEL